MTPNNRINLINTVLQREQLRPLSRLSRLLRDPVHALPYYVLATAARVRPFRFTFGTLWDTQMTCYLPEGNTFYYYGYCEANLTNFFLRYVKEEMVCLDVGAHVGIYTMLFSKLTGDAGHVHSFEPTPWTYKLLQQNTLELENVSINNRAVAEDTRTLSFADYGPGYGAYNSAHAGGAPALSADPVVTEVQSIALDQYCTDQNIVPDVVKIDSEGFEFEVLQGMKHMLAKSSRPIISIEVANDAEWAENRNQAFALLKESGYTWYQITPAGYLLPASTETNYQYDNLICVPKERIEECSDLFV